VLHFLNSPWRSLEALVWDLAGMRIVGPALREILMIRASKLRLMSLVCVGAVGLGFAAASARAESLSVSATINSVNSGGILISAAVTDGSGKVISSGTGLIGQ
jgi:hypothetical protein